jgi:recombinational DNA repair protein (RecF pathway)
MKKIDFLTGIKVWIGKVKDFKPCKVCGREWTPRSLDKDGVCPDCRKGIAVETSAWVKKMVFVYDNCDSWDEFCSTVKLLKEEGFFRKEENYLKCPYCQEFVDELYYSTETTEGMCKECFLLYQYKHKIEKKENDKKRRE